MAVELAAVRERAPDRPPRVLDVGGGSGAWAVPLAKAGCAVAVVDPSPNALAALRRRARDAGVDELVTAVPGDVDTLADVAPVGRADLVLGHGLLEVVDDVSAAVRALAARRRARWCGVACWSPAGSPRCSHARSRAGSPRPGRCSPTPTGGSAPTTRCAAASTPTGCAGRWTRRPTLRLELLQGDGVLECWGPAAATGGGAPGALGELEELAAA